MLIAARCGAAAATMAMPESYGTLSHLCASVAHESACAIPVTWDRSSGTAAAQRPNAPSTCTHAPRACALEMICASGSLAPVLTLPACAHDRWPVTLSEHDFERVRAHAALIIDRHEFDLLAAESEIAQRADGRDVHFVAGDHAHARSPLQPMRLDVPSGTAQDFMPRGGEA